MFILLNLFKIIVISLDSTENFSPVLQLGLRSPVASWWLPMGWGGRLEEGWKFKMVPSSVQCQTWHRQGCIWISSWLNIEGSLCQIQGYIRLHSIVLYTCLRSAHPNLCSTDSQEFLMVTPISYMWPPHFLWWRSSQIHSPELIVKISRGATQYSEVAHIRGCPADPTPSSL